MGFFKHLFEKEVCSFCNAECSSLNRKKYGDKYICGECDDKYGPVNSAGKAACKNSFEALLQCKSARELNLQKVKEFTITRKFFSELLFDENNWQIIIFNGFFNPTTNKLELQNPKVHDLHKLTFYKRISVMDKVNEDEKQVQVKFNEFIFASFEENDSWYDNSFMVLGRSECSAKERGFIKKSVDVNVDQIPTDLDNIFFEALNENGVANPYDLVERIDGKTDLTIYDKYFNGMQDLYKKGIMDREFVNKVIDEVTSGHSGRSAIKKRYGF